MPLPLAPTPAHKELDSPQIGDLCHAPVWSRAALSFSAPRALALWHLASFDAPTVAVVWSLAFAWGAGIRLPLWAPGLLALMAWSVYVGDRLLDARTGLHSPDDHPLRERHYFHWRHRFLLGTLAAVALLAAAAIILEVVPRAALGPDTLLGAAAFAYFSGVHSRRKLPRLVTKEFLVGVIFTAGCTLPTALRLNAHRSPVPLGPVLLPAIYFAALAWLNCHAIACWESVPFRRRGLAISTLGGGLFAVGAILACTLGPNQVRSAALIGAGAASALLLAVLDRTRHRLTPLALRATADAVLLTPLLLVPLARFLA